MAHDKAPPAQPRPPSSEPTDLPRRPRGGPLVSCLGSQTVPPSTFLSPDRFGTISVFELLEGSLSEAAVRARQIQDPLFPKPFTAVL